MEKTNKAFSLAEILVALVIIGIVASITIPGVLANKDKAVWVAQLQKTYATFENARKLTALDYGGDISSLFNSTDSTEGNAVLQAFAPHLNIAKNCGSDTGCLYDNLKYINGKLYQSNGKWESADAGWYGKAILADGTMVEFYNINQDSCAHDYSTAYSPSSFSHYCGDIWIDLNGSKPPNMFGRDVFDLEITKDGIYPGYVEDSPSQLNSACNPSRSHAYGYECAAKIFQEGAMNY